MTKLIETWEELAKLKNDKYKIAFDEELYNAHIIPVTDEVINKRGDFKCNCTGRMADEDFFKHHVYLSTHTFYGSSYKNSTKIMQEHGFDVEIDNWDKEEKKNGN